MILGIIIVYFHRKILPSLTRYTLRFGAESCWDRPRIPFKLGVIVESWRFSLLMTLRRWKAGTVVRSVSLQSFFFTEKHDVSCEGERIFFAFRGIFRVVCGDILLAHDVTVYRRRLRHKNTCFIVHPQSKKIVFPVCKSLIRPAFCACQKKRLVMIS